MKWSAETRDRLNYYTSRVLGQVDGIFFFLLDVFLKPRPRPDKILVIKVDAIGDYLLVRNFLPAIREAFPKAHINYICQNACQSLAEGFDRDQVNRFIYINRLRYGTSPFYRYRLLYRFRKAGFSMVLNPNFTRDIGLDEPLVMAAAAPVSIGLDGEMVRGKHNARTRRIADRYYSRLLRLPSDAWFEFERNRTFFAQALNQPQLPARLSISVPPLPERIRLPERFIVLFPGAGAVRRRWSAENFAQLADALWTRTGMDIVVCGSPAERGLANTLVAACTQARPLVLSGQTNLVDMVAVLGRASLLISNETSAVHMAAALALPTVVVSNANHFGRFTPYPAHIFPECTTLYPPEAEAILAGPDGWQELVRLYGQHSTLEIDRIPVERVLEASLARLGVRSETRTVNSEQ